MRVQELGLHFTVVEALHGIMEAYPSQEWFEVMLRHFSPNEGQILLGEMVGEWQAHAAGCLELALTFTAPGNGQAVLH